MVWRITVTILGDLPFITDVHNCIMGAKPMQYTHIKRYPIILEYQASSLDYEI